MKEVSTSIKLRVAKEILATAFINANENSITQGLSYKYTSRPIEEGEVKGWSFQISVKELGYGEKVLQEFNFQRPNNIDAKNMEYHVIVQMITFLTKDAIDTWYQIGKELATDKELQIQAKESLNGESKDNFSAN